MQSGALSLTLVFVIAILGFKYLAGYDWIESVWMVVVTLSTVGYSEGTDTTQAVQVFTIFVILIGVTSAAYTFGGFLQLMLQGEVAEALGKRKMRSSHIVRTPRDAGGAEPDLAECVS